jgi:hypothetical protein
VEEVEEAARSLLLFRCVGQNDMYTPCLNLLFILVVIICKFTSSCFFLIFSVFSIFLGNCENFKSVIRIGEKN